MKLALSPEACQSKARRAAWCARGERMKLCVDGCKGRRAAGQAVVGWNEAGGRGGLNGRIWIGKGTGKGSCSISIRIEENSRNHRIKLRPKKDIGSQL